MADLYNVTLWYFHTIVLSNMYILLCQLLLPIGCGHLESVNRCTCLSYTAVKNYILNISVHLL